MHAAQQDFDRFAAVVSEGYGVPIERLRGRDRTQQANFARRVLAICLREMDYSYSEIGDVLDRNHTSVIRLCNGQLDGGHRGKGRTTIETDVNAAKAEAKRLLGDEVPVRQPSVDKVDYGRTGFAIAVSTYRQQASSERDAYWIDYCRREWPHSWWAQASMFPTTCTVVCRAEFDR